MLKTSYKLEKEIPILDWKTNKFVRNLREEDLTEALIEELQHDNIKEIFLNGKNEIIYETLEGGGRFVADPFETTKCGNIGRYEIDPDYLADLYGNWLLYAAEIAVNVGTFWIDQYKVFHCVVGNTLWEITDYEHADRFVTLYKDNEGKTFYFRRIWPKERDQRGIPAGNRYSH